MEKILNLKMKAAYNKEKIFRKLTIFTSKR